MPIHHEMIDKRLMRRKNMRLVFDQIYRHNAVSRPRLAQLTGLTAMTTGRIADELIGLGIVCESSSQEEPGQGRPPKLVRVASDALRFVGISMERDGFRIGAIDPYGKTVRSAFVMAKLRGASPDEAAAWLVDAWQAFRADFQGPLVPVLGIAAPGLVDPLTGAVRFSSQFQWTDAPIRALVADRLPGIDVVVDNDVKAWTLAEMRFGATQGYMHSVLLNIGSGIGAAAVIDGLIYRGRDNSAGEIGHIVVNTNARLCECGKMGCLQTNLTDWAILQEARSVAPDISLDEVFACHDDGVPWARALIQRIVQNACIAVNLLANTYVPETVVLCGGLIEKYQVLWDLIQKRYMDYLADAAGKQIPLVRSAFGMDGGMIGASAIAFEWLLETRIS